MSRTQKNNVFIQAAFEKRVWEIAVDVMNQYKQGQLKDQKLSRKHLLATPEFKQHLLQPLHHLEADFQQSVLKRVQDNELSLAEMKKEAAEFRSLTTIKATFLRLTSTNTWNDAEGKFPTFTSIKRLSQYMPLDFRHGIPEVFRLYCQAALDSTATAGASTSSAMKIDVNGVGVHLIEARFKTISAQYLKDKDSSYSGAHLMIYRIPTVRYQYRNTWWEIGGM